MRIKCSRALGSKIEAIEFVGTVNEECETISLRPTHEDGLKLANTLYEELPWPIAEGLLVGLAERFAKRNPGMSYFVVDPKVKSIREAEDLIRKAFGVEAKAKDQENFEIFGEDD